MMNALNVIAVTFTLWTAAFGRYTLFDGMKMRNPDEYQVIPDPNQFLYDTQLEGDNNNNDNNDMKPSSSPVTSTPKPHGLEVIEEEALVGESGHVIDDVLRVHRNVMEKRDIHHVNGIPVDLQQSLDTQEDALDIAQDVEDVESVDDVIDSTVDESSRAIDLEGDESARDSERILRHHYLLALNSLKSEHLLNSDDQESSEGEDPMDSMVDKTSDEIKDEMDDEADDLLMEEHYLHAMGELEVEKERKARLHPRSRHFSP